MHNKDVSILCSSPNITWVIKSREKKWVEHVACTHAREENYTQTFYQKA